VKITATYKNVLVGGGGVARGEKDIPGGGGGLKQGRDVGNSTRGERYPLGG
jgi:hypothetical protein